MEGQDKDLLLFWRTVEGFLSRADEFHLYSKKGCQAVPQRMAWTGPGLGSSAWQEADPT